MAAIVNRHHINVTKGRKSIVLLANADVPVQTIAQLMAFVSDAFPDVRFGTSIH